MRVHLGRARAYAREAFELWRLQLQHPGIPLFDGGLLDSWPAWALDAIAICREETTAVQLFTKASEGGSRRG